MDTYSIALNAEQQLIDEQGWQVFFDGIEIVEQMLNALPDAYNHTDGLNEFVERIEALTRAVAIQAEQNQQEALPEMDLLVSEVDSTEPASDLLSANDEQNDDVNVDENEQPESVDDQVIEESVDEQAENSTDTAAPYSDIDPELLEVFIEEASDILESTEHMIQAWKNSPQDKAIIAEFQRELHTLKGGARMADISAIGDLAHDIESLAELVSDSQIQAGNEMFFCSGAISRSIGINDCGCS